ncbi:MAG: nucleotidyltransferase substrate binding protein [Chthoniobacterales bacterium]
MPRNPDVRWRQRFNSFQKAFSQLNKAAAIAEERELSELEEQGLIQAFEFTHELAWKTLKDFLEAHGTAKKIYGSKDATREAFAQGLLTAGEEWMEMIESRNETSHAYNEDTAEKIAKAILSCYVPEFRKLHETLGQIEKEEQ